MSDSTTNLIALRDQVRHLTDKVTLLEQALSRLMSLTAPPSSAPSDLVMAGVREAASPSAAGSTSTNRRTLLKWGGLSAAAALAAAGTVGTVEAHVEASTTTAQAASGNNLVLGVSNFAENGTGLRYDGSQNGVSIFTVDIGTANDGGISIAGYSGANGTGVFGNGSGATGIGVQGSSNSGYGVAGYSNTGIDLWARGAGRIVQALAGTAGPPTGGAHLAGEQMRDFVGDFYICMASGIPGTWYKVAAGIPGASGAIHFLPTPIRLLDTRTVVSWTAGSIHVVPIAGVSVGGIEVPVGAAGVVGNVTVVNPTSGGDLRLYPGTTAPSTSSINFASGQTIANGVTVGLNSAGQLTFHVDMAVGAHTNVLFDASGYIL